MGCDRSPTSAHTRSPRNMVPAYINSVPARCLVDSGASHSVCSGELYRRVLKRKNDGNTERLITKKENRNLLAADKSIMPVLASFDAEIKVNGLGIPITFDVVENLGYDALIGMSFLEATESTIDLRTNTWTLYDGLVTVAMTHLSGLTNTVFTVSNIVIPPYSECVFPVSTFKSPLKGEFIIEENLRSPNRALLVANALVDVSRKHLPCRVLNPTAKSISLRARTPVGELTPVTVASVSATSRRPNRQLPPISEMRAALEAKQLSLTDTAVSGQDLDNLIVLLYKNLDLVATSLKDLPGTDIMLHRIDTGCSAPIRTRG